MIRQEGHIGFLEAVLLSMTVLTVKALLPFPSLMIQTGDTAGWLLLLLIGLWTALGLLAIGRLMDRFPGRSLPEAVREVAGPVAGVAVNLVLVAWLLVDGALGLRLFTEAFIVSILPRTPPSVLSLVALAVAIYAGYLGLEAIARANVILWPLLAVTFVAVLALVLPQARADWLFPFWGPGPGVLVRESTAHIGFMSEAILLAFYAYALRGRGELTRAAVTALAVSTVALAIMVAVYVAVFGTVAAVRQPFPFFNLARLIYVGRFFQRLESVFVLFWVLGAIVRVSIFLHAAAITASTTLGLPYFRPLLAPLAVLLYGISLLPPDYVQVIWWESRLRQLEVIPAFLLPIALLALRRMRRREVPSIAG